MNLGKGQNAYELIRQKLNFIGIWQMSIFEELNKVSAVVREFVAAIEEQLTWRTLQIQ